MRVSSFIDTDIFVYAIDAEAKQKHKSALHFLYWIEKEEKIHVSNQIVKELTDTAIRREIFNEAQLVSYLDAFSGHRLSVISLKKTKESVRIKHSYQLSFYDSLIVATAIENNCTKLYSENLNNGQSIEGLKIINPFKD
jgi:predicted nucleic acid-binding protein